ncbi:hypothetical protein HMPREF9711_00510 [Myroides odoratimimus CCUG 3837]|nr:hypothetical protein HMPREF9711_00510 [Myroides odoratimimus CCUG 3837]
MIYRISGINKIWGGIEIEDYDTKRKYKNT